MADNVPVTAGSGTVIAADEVIDGTLGTVKVQYVKIMDGTLDGTSKATVNTNGLKVEVNGSLPAGSNAIGGVTANVTSIGGNAVNTGNGTVGTGTQRVVIASDNTVLPAVGAGATAATVPANASYTGLNPMTALPTAATAGNLVGASSDKFGRQIVLMNTIRDLHGSQRTTITSSTSETTIVTAGASGIFNDILSIKLANISTTGTQVDIRDATSGTIIDTFYVPGGDLRGAVYSTPWAQTTAANNWTAQCVTSVASVIITVQFAKNK